LNKLPNLYISNDEKRKKKIVLKQSYIDVNNYVTSKGETKSKAASYNNMSLTQSMSKTTIALKDKSLENMSSIISNSPTKLKLMKPPKKFMVNHSLDTNNEETKTPSMIQTKPKVEESKETFSTSTVQAKNYIKCFSSRSRAGMTYEGTKKTNQDSYITCTDVLGLNDFHLFGVMDGHGIFIN
jgi:hypothetical protein